MRPNECSGSPLSANYPRTRVTVGTSLILTQICDVLTVGAYHFFWEQVVFAWVMSILVSFKVGALPLPWERYVSAVWCGCVFGRCNRGI